MDGNRDSGHAERVRQLRDANPDPGGDYFIIDRAAFNQGENAKFDMQITRGGYCPTLVARGPCAVVTPVD